MRPSATRSCDRSRTMTARSASSVRPTPASRFCRPCGVPPKTSSRVMSSCAATCSHRGAAAMRSASEFCQAALPRWYSSTSAACLTARSSLLAAQPGGDAATADGELEQRQPAADGQRRPDAPEPAPVGVRRCRPGRRGRARAGRRRSAVASTALARRAPRAAPPPRASRDRVLPAPVPRTHEPAAPVRSGSSQGAAPYPEIRAGTPAYQIRWASLWRDGRERTDRSI